jgi:hypothetical protein
MYVLPGQGTIRPPATFGTDVCTSEVAASWILGTGAPTTLGTNNGTNSTSDGTKIGSSLITLCSFVMVYVGMMMVTG